MRPAWEYKIPYTEILSSNILICLLLSPRTGAVVQRLWVDRSYVLDLFLLVNKTSKLEDLPQKHKMMQIEL